VIAACVTLGVFATRGLGQEVKDSDKMDETDSEVVTLSPFVVQNEDEEGYRADKTLVGSRTAKSLMEISNSIAIINRETIDDLNAVDVSSLQQVGVAGVSQNQTINDDYNIRGFRSLFSLRDGITKVAYKRNPLTV
jgi:outer membrane receptor for ferric coprogen and ferric-rhodotorulic acid